MKSILALVMFSTIALADQTPRGCYKLATKKALKTFPGRVVDEIICEPKIARDGHLYHRCNIIGSNGVGAGDFEMKILLDGQCSRVTFSEVVGQE